MTARMILYAGYMSDLANTLQEAKQWTVYFEKWNEGKQG